MKTITVFFIPLFILFSCEKSEIQEVKKEIVINAIGFEGFNYYVTATNGVNTTFYDIIDGDLVLSENGTDYLKSVHIP